MVGWHHQLSGHEFVQTLGDSEGQGSLMCCSPWGHKESDKLSTWTTITGEMNEAIRTDETAKETSGKAGRLDTDKDTGRHKDRGMGRDWSIYLLNYLHKFTVLFLPTRKFTSYLVHLLKQFTLPLFRYPGVPNDPDPAWACPLFFPALLDVELTTWSKRKDRVSAWAEKRERKNTRQKLWEKEYPLRKVHRLTLSLDCDLKSYSQPHIPSCQPSRQHAELENSPESRMPAPLEGIKDRKFNQCSCQAGIDQWGKEKNNSYKPVPHP